MKLYIIVRGDLPPGAQLAQSCHAAFSLAGQFPEEVGPWNRVDQNLVVLQAPNEGALWELLGDAMRAHVSVTGFCEPDLDDSLTAVAMIGENAGKLVSSLPLALRAPRAA